MVPQFDLPHYIDNSMLSAWRSCRRKFFWSFISALYPTGKSVHLTAGAAFAAGVDAARKLAFTAGADISHDSLCEAAFHAFIREWGDFDPPDNSTKSLVNTFSALEDYLKQYHPLHDIIQPHFKPDGSPAVEYTFSIPLDGPEYPRHPSGEPFIFVGRFDMLGYYGRERLPVIVDEKTTGSLGFAWEQQWDLRGQFMGYIWAMQQLGFNISHAAVRGIAILKTKNEIRTALPEYGPHMIARWHLQLIKDLIEITQTYHAWRSRAGQHVLAEGFWDQNFADACSSYGGCAFSMLCSAKRAEPFFSNYILHRWNPLERNPVKELPAAVPTFSEANGGPQDPMQGKDPKCDNCSPSQLPLPLSPASLDPRTELAQTLSDATSKLQSASEPELARLPWSKPEVLTLEPRASSEDPA